MINSIRLSITRSALLALIVIAAACGNRDDTTEPTSNGSIVLTIGAPEGISPAVTVTGPNGFSRNISSTTTLTHLAAGSYSITADSVVTPDAIVGYSVDTAAIIGNPIIVTAAGSSPASVSYAFARRHGALWVANIFGDKVSAFAASQLLTSATVDAADSLGHVDRNAGIAIDADHNMWVSDLDTDTLKMFTLAQRSAHGSPTPARVIVSPSISSAQQIAFDSHGNLWVADWYNGLVRFTAAQVTAGGSGIVADVIVSDHAPEKVAGTYAVTFDADGSAWASEYSAANLVKYTSDMLASSGSPPPAVRIGVAPPSTRVLGPGAFSASVSAASITGNGVPPEPLSEPNALAFDIHGNLWVGNFGNGTVTSYTPAQLVSNGNPTPSITLTLPGAAPLGLAFDRSGGLWVSNDPNFAIPAIYGFSAVQLTTSGITAPQVILLPSANDPIDGPGELAFDEEIVSKAPAATPSITARPASAGLRASLGRKRQHTH